MPHWRLALLLSVGRKNSSYPTSLASLEEASEHLVTLHQLNVPATLSLSLLSTNAIENAMRNYRGQAAKVTQWLPAANQISR